MRDRHAFGWTIAFPDDPSWAVPGGPMAYHVQPTRRESMEHFVARWRTGDHDGLTVSQVWQIAYRRGWRLVRVMITRFGDRP